MQTQPASSPISPLSFSKDFLANPEFRAMVRNELADILTDFIATQEKRASEVSLIERIVRVEEAQRSHEQLTRTLLEQMDKRFDELSRRLERFMFWSLGLTVSATFLIITMLR